MTTIYLIVEHFGYDTEICDAYELEADAQAFIESLPIKDRRFFFVEEVDLHKAK